MSDERIDLDARRLGLAVMRLSKMEGNPIARTVISKIIRAWDPMYGPVRGDRRFCSVKLAEPEAEVYRSLAIKSLLQCTYTAVYVDPEDPTTEVKVCSEKRPPKRATFNVRGGKRRLTRKSLKRTEENNMARTKKSSAAVTDGLDGLDELELDDDDDEDEAPVAAKKSKTKAKAETPAEKRRRVKAEKAAAAEAEDEDDDDEDEDDEDEDEDDDDEDEPAPVAKKSSKKSSAKPASKKKGTPVGRALPEGKFGVEQVAALAGTTGRAVRIYCRTNDIEKAEGLGRYAWSEKAATALAKKIKAGSK